jgi:hypothetical protein
MRALFSIRSLFALLLTGAALANPERSHAEEGIEFNGVGWVQAGRVEHSFAVPNTNNDYNRNWIGHSGGFLKATSHISEDWEGALAMGAMLVHLARGSKSVANIWYPFWIPIIPEARLTYTTPGFRGNSGLQVNLGAFIYDYNPDVKNLGLYLLRGYIYPGALVSQFEDKHILPVASVFGAMASYKHAGWKNDFIVKSETDDKPLFDISIADVVTWKAGPSLELGAGVNFYRALPQNSKATSPGKDCNSDQLGAYPPQGQDNPCFIIEKDAAGNVKDTVLGSLAGTKLMGRFRLDPKPLLGSPAVFGEDDLVLYGEAAILGLKNHPIFYDRLLRRVPVMAGLNFPGFGLLNLSVEVEYFAQKISSDALPPQNGAWLPTVDPAIDNSRDDWKWSVYASRMFFGHMKLSGQIANDHMRLGGSPRRRGRGRGDADAQGLVLGHQVGVFLLGQDGRR